jgi:hypothetical protein
MNDMALVHMYRDGMCGKMKERMIALLVKGMIGGRSEVAREKEGGRAHYWNKSRSNESTIKAISNHERTFKKNKKSEDEKCADAAGGWAMQSSVAILTNPLKICIELKTYV